ncbi:MAG: hypothetical protein WC071_08685 [Victivallaceae bacterium]
MNCSDVVLLIFFFFLYVVIPLLGICWAIRHWRRRQRNRQECRKAYELAQLKLEAQLNSLLQDGLALDANVWLLSDNEDIAEIFFDLLFRTARKTRPILLPECSAKAISFGTNISPTMSRLQKFQRAGLLITHKDGIALTSGNCPAVIQVTVCGNDLFNRRIDYNLLTGEIAEAYRNWLKANIR